MRPDADEIYDHLGALRASLAANQWLSAVDATIVALFNEILAGAKDLRPNARLLHVIEKQKPNVRPHTLLALADQILLVLDT